MLGLWLIAFVMSSHAAPPVFEPARFAVASELLMPRAVAFAPPAGEGFETRSWQLRAVVGCVPVDGRKIVVRCTVEQAAMQGSAFRRNPDHDPVQVAAVLEDHSQGLVGMALDVQLSPRGKVQRWSTSGRPDGSARQTAKGLLLELTLERALAGLWVEWPVAELAVGGQWVETGHSPLFTFPRVEGNFSVGTSQVLHQVAGMADGVLTADCRGESTFVDNGEQLRGDGRCRTVWKAGAMTERTWSIDGVWLDTVRYHHAGWLRRLAAGEAVDLGPIRQVRGPGEPPEADVPGLPEWPAI